MKSIQHEARTLNVSNPEPGIYPNIPFEIYHQIDLASSHRLSDLRRSPGHCRHSIDNPRPETPALKYGTAIHTALLEPTIFSKKYVVSGQCEGILSSGKNSGQRCTNGGTRRDSFGTWFCGQHSKSLAEETGVTILTDKQFKDIEDRVDAIVLHENVSMLMRAVTDKELTIIAIDENTGLKYKTRLDMLLPSIRTVADFKSTRDASPRKFLGQCEAYSYYVQAALNLRACQAHGIDVDKWTAIAFESQGYCGVRVYPFSDAVIDLGRVELDRLMPIYDECQKSGEWPGYYDDMEEVDLPAWKMREAYIEQE